MLNNQEIAVDIEYIISPNFIRLGDKINILISIYNSGSVNILRDPDNNVNICYHWYDKFGNIIEYEGIRTMLPKTILVGEAIEADVLIRAPFSLGDYELCCTLVYENKFWLNEINKKSYKTKIFNIVRWEKHFNENCVFSYPYYKQKQFRPLIIELENTNFCTNSCVICPNKNLTRRRQDMDMTMYRKFVSDYDFIGGGNLLVAPQIGEVFCDEKIIEKLRIAKSMNLITSIYSNGIFKTILNDEDYKFIVGNISYIYLSIYGINNEEYKVMTNKDTYQEMIKNVKKITKNSIIKNKLIFQFRFLKHHYKSEIEIWMYENFGELYNYSVCDQFANWAGGISTVDVISLGGRMLPQPDYEGPCILPYLYHVVFVNGDVSFCPCADFNAHPDFNLGNIVNNSLFDLLKCEKLEMFFNSTFMPNLCKQCSFYTPPNKMPSILSEYM